jgi:hypothetical protein
VSLRPEPAPNPDRHPRTHQAQTATAQIPSKTGRRGARGRSPPAGRPTDRPRSQPRPSPENAPSPDGNGPNPVKDRTSRGSGGAASRPGVWGLGPQRTDRTAGGKAPPRRTRRVRRSTHPVASRRVRAAWLQPDGIPRRRCEVSPGDTGCVDQEAQRDRWAGCSRLWPVIFGAGRLVARSRRSGIMYECDRTMMSNPGPCWSRHRAWWIRIFAGPWCTSSITVGREPSVSC